MIWCNNMNLQIAAYPLRMPPELREWFDLLAKENGRSLNSELVQCLKEIRARELVPSELVSKSARGEKFG